MNGRYDFGFTQSHKKHHYFQDLLSFVHQQAAIVEVQSKTINEQSKNIHQLNIKLEVKSATIDEHSTLMIVTGQPRQCLDNLLN